MSEKAERFFEELKNAIEADKLVLPSLPEVALKIRDVVDSDAASAQQVSDILTQDAALSARLIQVANSPLYRTRNPIEDLQMAITRLGLRLVRDLVMSLAMKQIFEATSDVLDDQFRATWNASVTMAAICRMLSNTVPGMNSEQALLAGLIHNIGALPILALAEVDDDLVQDAGTLHDMIWDLQGPVGELILESWHFPQPMIEVVKECHNFNYSHDGAAAYVDLVQAALLQSHLVGEKHAPADWSTVAAFAKLGMDTEINIIDIKENQEIIEETKESLMI